MRDFIVKIKKSFVHTIPVLIGYLFLGTAYGIYMVNSGYSFIYPIISSIFIYAGSMEFSLVNLFGNPFNVINIIFLTLMINGRHIFYDFCMIDKYKNEKNLFLLSSGLTDETFAVNSNLDDKSLYLTVTLMDHLYWILGCLIGSIIGEIIPIKLVGIDFVMTALFVVIFVDNFMKSKIKITGFIGIVISLICLFIFGKQYFMVISLLLIVIILLIFRRKLVKNNE